MTRSAHAAPDIDIVVESKLWSGAPKAAITLRRAVAAAAAELSTKRAELAIVLTDDSAIRLLNRDWRGVDAATNVLSFPTNSRPHPNGDGRPGVPHLLGDIVLAYETIAREARQEDKPFASHLAHLAVHGFLHLLGYDHERDDDADRMEKLERDILARLAIADPYRRAAPA
jgi:probable rRNA maturation factor